MTLVEIFEHIITGFEFNGDKVDGLLNKAEDVVYGLVDKTLDILK